MSTSPDTVRLSGIHVLPNELLSKILEIGYLEYHRNKGREFRTTASLVERLWRECVVSIPRMWNEIHISLGAAEPLRYLQLCLERSGALPLSLEFSKNTEECPTDLATLVNLAGIHSTRWRGLTIEGISNAEEFHLFNRLPTPALEKLFIKRGPSGRMEYRTFFDSMSMPVLQSLMIRDADLSATRLQFSSLKALFLDCVGLNNALLRSLENCPHLQIFKLERVLETPELILPAKPPFTLPALQFFNIHLLTSFLNTHISALLESFSLPNIGELCVSQWDGARYKGVEELFSYHRWHHLQIHPHLNLTGRARIKGMHFCLPIQRSSISVLELDSIIWPSYRALVDVFAELSNLETLLIKHIPALLASFPDFMPENDPFEPLPLSALRHLELSVGSTNPGPYFWGSSALDVHRMNEFFNGILSGSTGLEQLTQEDINITLEIPHHSLQSLVCRCQTPGSVPKVSIDNIALYLHLNDLTLDKVNTNEFLALLLVNESSEIVCPDLRTLTITCDPLFSRPLVHRVIDSRRSFGCPITKLTVDPHFARNKDSLEWLKENVETVIYIDKCSQHP